MTISSDKVRVSIVIDKGDKEILDKIAKEDSRSINNLISVIIKNYIKSLPKE